MNILVVEDNPTDSKLVGLLLAAAGHGVRSVQAAADAMDRVRAEKPELILLDLDLPDIDGLTFIRMLKQDDEVRVIPVVAVTAYPERWRRAAALEAGCDAYVVKPIDTRTFVNEATDIVHGKGQ
jgi:CheY-like chemotaxis protein